MFRFSVLTLLFIGCYLFSSAQTKDTASAQNKKNKYQQPKFLLFMLHLSTNKIEGLRRRGMERDIPMVLAADSETNQSIMKDFADHFKFCQVYFFYDTYYDQAKSKKWSEIKFFDSQSKLQKVSMSSTEACYFAEVSYAAPSTQLPVDSSVSSRMFDRLQGVEDDAASRNYGLNLYDADFMPLRNKLYFTDISLRRRGPLLGNKKFVFVGADRFDRKLREKYGNPSKE